MKGTKKGGQALYEGGARIPFIVVWPGVVKPGTTSAEPVVTTDVFPTMLGMAGGKTADYPKLDGLSLVPVLKGAGGLDRKAVVLYRSYEDQYAAVRSGKWKYIAYRRGKNELFDLEKDLSESRDLSSEMPGQVDELKAVLRAFEKEMDVPGLVER
jgi:arylsulfatase A-like enzyme